MGVLLTNREYKVKETDCRTTWYSPEKFLKSFKSVVTVKYIDTSSSAGDWTGLIVQKIGKHYFYIIFSQYNSSDCFTVNTNEEITAKTKVIEDYLELENMLNEIINNLYS